MKSKWLCRSLGRLFCCLISMVAAAGLGFAQAPATTAIHDVVYRADGRPATGQVVISWPAFTTSDQKPVPAGSLAVQLGTGGTFDVALAPNAGATPEGSYYKVVFHLEGAPPSTETWSVPALAETTISAVRATVMPATAAVQVASRAYVDSVLAGKAASGANADITSLALGNGAPWLQRDAADALAVSRGSNAQRFSVYNTRTDTANYERFSAGWSGDAAYLRTENGGTGAVRPLRLGAGEAPSFELQPGKATVLGVLSADGYLDMSGTAAYPIYLDPPAFGGTGVGWKLGLWQNVYALGIANNTIAAKTGKWFSVFNGNPANDASSSVPDSAAGVSLGGDGTLVAGAGSFTSVNAVRKCDQFAGADAGAKIAACIADLPATGGSADARGLEGAQSIHQDVFSGQVKPVKLLLGHATYTMSVGQTFTANGQEVIGEGLLVTIINYTPAAGTAFKSSDQSTSRTSVRLEGFKLKSTAGAGATSKGVDFSGISDSIFRDLYVQDFGTQIYGEDGLGGSTYYNQFEHIFVVAGSAGSGYYGVHLKGSANANKFYGLKGSRCSSQFYVEGGTNEIGVYGGTFEAADDAAVDIVWGSNILFANPRFESNNTGIRIENAGANRGIVIDTPQWSNNTTDFADNGYGLTIRNPGSLSNESVSNGLNQVSAPNLVPNANFEGWASSTQLYGWNFASTSNWAYGSTTVTQEATIVRSGFSAKIGTAGTNVGIATAAIPVDPTKSHGMTLWWASSNHTTYKLYPLLRLLDSAGSVITTGTVVAISKNGASAPAVTSMAYTATYNAHYYSPGFSAAVDNTLQRTTWIFKFPSNVASVQIGLFAIGGAGATIYADDVYFAQGPVPTAAYSRPLPDSGAQTFYGNLAILGSATIGGGTAITKHLSATATLDFVAITAPGCAPDLTITVPGAADGDTVDLGVPSGSVTAGVAFFAWVSAADTVSVRACAFTGTPNPASGAFRVDVWKH